MEPLEQYFVECVIWKREMIAGIERTWCNTYQFTANQPLEEGTAHTLMHNLGTGEQFMYSGYVEIFGIICWQWSLTERYASRDRVFLWPNSSYGNRPRPEGEIVLPWEYALLLTKEATTGKGSRMAYRRTLTEAETVPYKETSRAIGGHEPWGIFHTNLVLYWLNNTPLEYAIYQRLDELHPPTTTRAVTRIGMGALTKFQSIEDAQARKTFRAKPYEERWKYSLPFAFMGYHQALDLATSHPDGMLKEDVQDLSTMSAVLKGTFVYLADYWTEGVKPVLQLNWRPTAGLDPSSLVLQQVVVDAAAQIDELGDIIQDLYSYPEERVPYEAVKPFLLAYSYYVLILDRVGAMRWTGTPLPPVVSV